jgi:hypothetical protein
MGQSSGLVNDIKPVKEVINTLISGYDKTVRNLQN